MNCVYMNTCVHIALNTLNQMAERVMLNAFYGMKKGSQLTAFFPCYDSIIVLYETAAHLLVRHFPIALSAVLQQPLHQQWHR